MTTKDRLKEFLKFKNVGRNRFETSIGISTGYVSSKGITITSDVIEKTKMMFPDLSLDWLLSGEGEMLKENISNFTYGKEIPFYSDLPVSAGKMGLAANNGDKEEPTGYMSIPNVSAKYLFPVIGYSFLPIIKPGDVIGVNDVNLWDRVEPDKIYLIVTHEDRMIKRLRIDEDNSILWCVSENYKEFKILKNDIKSIYHVVWHGELL